MQRVLVTGGAGFIGSHLCEALLVRGCDVTCLDNFSTGRRENVEHLAALHLVEGDANDQATWQQFSGERFDVVYHYAATVGVRRTEEMPSLVLQDVQGMLNVANKAEQGEIGRIVFASSSEVYGEPKKLPEVEAEGQIGWSPYTVVKLYGEHLYQMLWQQKSIPTVSLRFFNVYGPRQRGSAYGFVTAQFISQVLSGQRPTVFGDGTQTRDFVYVDDNIAAAVAAAELPEAAGAVVNVGTGRETQIIDLANLIISLTDGGTKLTPQFLPSRAVEISRRCASTAKMREVLQYDCRCLLEEGLRMTVDDHVAAVATVSPPVLKPVASTVS